MFYDHDHDRASYTSPKSDLIAWYIRIWIVDAQPDQCQHQDTSEDLEMVSLSNCLHHSYTSILSLVDVALLTKQAVPHVVVLALSVMKRNPSVKTAAIAISSVMATLSNSVGSKIPIPNSRPPLRPKPLHAVEQYDIIAHPAQLCLRPPRVDKAAVLPLIRTCSPRL